MTTSTSTEVVQTRPTLSHTHRLRLVATCSIYLSRPRSTWSHHHGNWSTARQTPLHRKALPSYGTRSPPSDRTWRYSSVGNSIQIPHLCCQARQIRPSPSTPMTPYIPY